MVIGHERNAEYFDKIIESGKISHAYCFCGQKGIGKSMFASAVAEKILCKGDAGAIARFRSRNHPDFLYISTEDTKKQVALVKLIEEFFFLKPFFSDYRVLIIDDAEHMNESFQNKILKNLEESPKKTVIIIIVDNENKLLQTIRSRVITINFNPLSDDELKKIISRDEILIDDRLIRLANGSIGYYKRWINDEEFIDKMSSLIEKFKYILMRDAVQKIQIVGIIKSLSKDFSYVVDILIMYIRSLICLLKGMDSNKLVIVDRFEESEIYEIKKIIEKYDIDENRLIGMIDTIVEANQKIKNSQNEELVIENMIHRLTLFGAQGEKNAKGHRSQV